MIPTNAGTTHKTVDFALIGRERGATTVALTPMAYETDPRLIPEHASGKRLNEVADIVVDLGGRYGDTELDFTCGTSSFSAIPGSGIAGMLAMWMIFAQATELLCERGTPPLTWDSTQMPGVHAANLERFADYRRSRNGVTLGVAADILGRHLSLQRTGGQATNELLGQQHIGQDHRQRRHHDAGEDVPPLGRVVAAQVVDADLEGAACRERGSMPGRTRSRS